MPLDFKKLSVLVVEDTRAMRQLMEVALETLGVGRVYSASNGEKGFELFVQHGPDIVFADWEMEPVNGIELTQKIRTSDMSPNKMVPIIIVTGYSSLDRVSKARDAGATEFLVKPFSANDIARRIAYVINKPRDFIDVGDYFGPCRRRRVDPNYNGPFRREEDKSNKNAASGKKS